MDSPLKWTLGARMSAYLTSTDDYRRHRKNINKNLVRIRRKLGLVTKDTKNYEDKVALITSDKYDENKLYGSILLLTAERDMLYALEIKNMLEISNENVSSYKNLMLSRMKKSLSTSKLLLQVIQNENDFIIKIESYVYAAIVQGFFSINKRKWDLALDAFSFAKCALEFLSAKLKSSESSETSQGETSDLRETLFKELLDELVDPSLNLALSQSGQSKITSDIKTVSRKRCSSTLLPYLAPVVEIIKKSDPNFFNVIPESTELLRSITWRKHEAELYNDEIALKLTQIIQEQNESINYTESSQFDVLSANWSEVLDDHLSDVEKNRDDDDLEKVQSRAILLTFINYNLFFTRIKRDTLLIDESARQSKPDIAREIKKDIIRLYGNIINTVQQVKDLPGVYNDDDLLFSLDNLEKLFDSKKKATLAEIFTLNNKHKESLKILHHIHSELPSSGSKFYEVEQFPYDVSSNSSFESFKEELEEKLREATITVQLYEDNSKVHSQDNFVVSNIDKFATVLDDMSNVANLKEPLVLNPLLSKPVLFDIGFNYISYDMGTASPYNAASSNLDLNSSDSKSSSKKQGGFFGLFGRNK
ncbi:Piso0_001960 [Millerozyma farinosa CBS 7064]|uniref:Signal recognition particle subunit SRP68 n=1 Tax=Pichia sorbitophila (strain ATCC MYA-4447 / BCRC 22081 / CBS 7064 / NBRC 10061 / NRRL Y-12695) TaxID=559304 RepID=G8YBB3_PICSO|nr:Piso0_001960 [Millerozyma farinosa CBS 7064]